MNKFTTVDKSILGVVLMHLGDIPASAIYDLHYNVTSTFIFILVSFYKLQGNKLHRVISKHVLSKRQ